MIKTKAMNTSDAIKTLERQYNAKYNGTITVREMISSLTDAISWENESPDKVYHQFTTVSDMPNHIVADDQLLLVACSYA